MKYFCINLVSANDRRAHCEEQFAKANIDVSFVRGVDTRRNGIGRLNHDMSSGMVGCYLSHWRLLDEVARYDHGPCSIFEDDVALADGFSELLATAVASLPEDWEVAFPGWYECSEFGWATSQPFVATDANTHWQVHSSGQFWGTHAYLVNGRRGAEAILRCIEPVTTTVDSQLYCHITEGSIRAYFIKDRIAHQSFTHETQTS